MLRLYMKLLIFVINGIVAKIAVLLLMAFCSSLDSLITLHLVQVTKYNPGIWPTVSPRRPQQWEFSILRCRTGGLQQTSVSNF